MGKVRSEATNLTYPIAKITGFDVHLERNFYGVRLRSHTDSGNSHKSSSSSREGSIRADSEEAILKTITNIEYVQVT